MKPLIENLSRNLPSSTKDIFSSLLSNPNLFKVYRSIDTMNECVVAKETLKPGKEIIGISYDGIISSSRIVRN